MPRRAQGPTPPHLEPRAVWERECAEEVVRLRPHLANAPRVVKTIVATARAASPATDGKTAAQRWDATNAQSKP